jgi:hypothetical protein
VVSRTQTLTDLPVKQSTADASKVGAFNGKTAQLRLRDQHVADPAGGIDDVSSLSGI